MGGNKITSLGEPTEATDAINRNFLHKRLTAATAAATVTMKTEFAEHYQN